MRFWLETHAVLWHFHEPEQLGTNAAAAIQGPDHRCCISAATFWEMAIKAGLGKLTLAAPLPAIRDEFVACGVEILDISADDCMGVQELPLHHRDPFDRLIAVQAMNAGLKLVSKDAIFDQYGVDRIW
jgi:PIN domain nuclease of toxin-antitoxin system